MSCLSLLSILNVVADFLILILNLFFFKNTKDMKQEKKIKNMIKIKILKKKKLIATTSNIRKMLK